MKHMQTHGFVIQVLQRIWYRVSLPGKYLGVVIIIQRHKPSTIGLTAKRYQPLCCFLQKKVIYKECILILNSMGFDVFFSAITWYSTILSSIQLCQFMSRIIYNFIYPSVKLSREIDKIYDWLNKWISSFLIRTEVLWYLSISYMIGESKLNSGYLNSTWNIFKLKKTLTKYAKKSLLILADYITSPFIRKQIYI